MTYLYIDESGDLGFGKNGSDYFIIACVKINDERTNFCFKRIVKKIRQRKLSKKFKDKSELKFSNSSELIRIEFLKRAAKLNIEIYSLIIKKEYTKKDLRDNLPILYNYLISILLEKPLTIIDNSDLIIFLDKCMSPSQRRNFETYTKTKFLSVFNKIPKIILTHDNSSSNEGLQVVDFISGAFGYKYNTARLQGDFNNYTNIIKNKIVVERNDLFRK